MAGSWRSSLRELMCNDTGFFFRRMGLKGRFFVTFFWPGAVFVSGILFNGLMIFLSSGYFGCLAHD